MTPAEYLNIIALPTLAEFMNEPTDQRRAYLACITAAHLVDQIDVAQGSPAGGKHSVRQAVRAISPRAAACLKIVEAVCNGTKHAKPDPNPNRPVKFSPGDEQGIDELSIALAGLPPFSDQRWGRPGLAINHHFPDDPGEMGCYYIDDCIRVAIRAYASAYPTFFAGVDLSAVAEEHDRPAPMSFVMSVIFGD